MTAVIYTVGGRAPRDIQRLINVNIELRHTAGNITAVKERNLGIILSEMNPSTATAKR